MQRKQPLNDNIRLVHHLVEMANSSKNTFNIRNVAFVAAWREIFGLNYFRQSWVRFILGAHAAQSVRETLVVHVRYCLRQAAIGEQGGDLALRELVKAV